MLRELLLRSKCSDTLAVLGSGASLNTLTEKQLDIVFSTFDTFALNWYCKGALQRPRYYLVDEQGVNGYKVIPGFTPQDVIDKVRAEIILIKKRNRDAEEWKWERHTNLLKGKTKITIRRFGSKHIDLKEIKDIDFYNDGVINLNTCLANAIHFAIWMRYKRVVFLGVDLYNSEYFWGPNPIVALDNLSSDSPHPQADNIVNLVKDVAELYKEIEWLVHNPKSLLANVIETWNDD